MKQMKILIPSAVLLATLCACTGQTSQKLHSHPEVLTEPGTFPIIKEEYRGEVSLKIMGASNAAINPDWSKNKFFIRFSEETGVDFTFNVYGDGMYNDKKAFALATNNNLPDIFFKAALNNYDEVTYGGKTLRPLNDLIDEYAPNIKQLLEDNPIVKKSITTTDGNIYALPTIYTNLPNNTTSNMRGFFWINKDWMGTTPMPKTPAEYKAILQTFRQERLKIRDSYPLVVAGIDDLLKIFNFFGLDLVNYWVQGDEDGQLVFGPKTDNFKQGLAFIKSLIDDNLMNANWSTMEAAEINARGASGDYYGSFVQAGPQFAVGFNKMRQYTTLDPLSVTGEGGFWGAKNPLQRGCFALTYECKYPEAAIRMMDALYDIDAPYGLWSSIGKENEEWQWLDEEHTAWKSTISDNQYSEVMSTTIIQTGDGMPYAIDESFWEKQATETDTYTRPLRNRQMTFGKVGYPDVYFDSVQLTEMADLSTDINTHITRYIAGVLNGSKNLEGDWETFIKFSRLNLDRYLEILQERYDDFNQAIQ
ncbi:MAG: hypothetical protein ACOX3K_02065 [Bacilli bacterium]